MASTVWKGHLTFGLVSIPVKLHRAARAEKVSFRQLHAATAGRVKQVYVREDADEPADIEEEDDRSHATYSAPATQKAAFTAMPRRESAAPPPLPAPVPIRGGTARPMPVPPPRVSPDPPPLPVVERSELVKGYEYAKGQFVTVSKEDLEKITPQTAREMEILEFVKLAEVDPIYFETSYYVTPDRAGERAYALLFTALQKSGYVALAQFAMHNREHVVVIRAARTGIVLHTMFYETEIRREDEYRTDTSGVNDRELQLALMLVESLAAPFESAKYRDSYKEKLDELIAAKIAGEETVEPPAPKAKPVGDIMAALERSLALSRKPVASAPKPSPATSEAPAPKRRKTK
jgi:DNA end-binding protein Ku